MGDERLSWLDRWWLYRDRLIASPRVQRWALANPLTRPVAQRRARAMLDLCAGFVYSQALFTCVRLRLFDILFKGPLTIAALAERLLLSPEATSRLLDAAVSLGLAERRGRSVYGLGQLGAALAGNRAALSLIEHQPLLYADLQDPVALLRGSPRGTGIARYWPYSAATHPTELTAPMPDGADVISLIRIVHDHDDASAVTLLRAVHRARAAAQRHAPHRRGDVGRGGRRTARRLLWILHPRYGPRRAKDRRGDQQVAAASRLQPLSSSAQPNAHPNQHPRRPADFELRIGFTMRATVRAASLRSFALQPIGNVSGVPTA